MTARSREHLWALALIMFVALVYLWPVLIAGKVLSPNSVLFLFAPWRYVAPADFEHTWNPVLSDIPTAYYPWNVFARTLIHTGTFPAWNPYAYSGTPFFANSQTGILSPFNLPLWILPLNYGIAVASWIKLCLGGMGAYLLARELKLAFWPGMLAGISFMLCAFNIVWITYETLPGAAAMMPWAFFLGERIVRRRHLGDALWLAVVTAVAILAGHPETAVQVLVAAFLYVVFRLLVSSSLGGVDRLRTIVLVVMGMSLGALLSAVVLLPVLRAGLGTPGAAFRTGGTSNLPWSAIKTAMFPYWWEIRTLPLPGPANFNERTLYVGAATLVLACAALVSRGNWRSKLPLGILAVMGVAISFGLPVAHWIGSHVWPLNRTTTSRMLLWFELAVPVLSAYGLQSLMDTPRRQRAPWIFLIVAGVAVAIAVVTIDPSLHELRTTINHLRTGRDYADPKVIALSAIGWWVIFSVLIAAVLIVLRVTGRVRWAAPAIVLLVAVDLLHFSHGYQPMLSAKKSSLPVTPAIAYLQKQSNDRRIVGFGNTLANDYDMVYGLRDVRGYDPPQPSYRYLRLWQLANPAQIAVEPFQVNTMTATGLKVMSLLGVHYLIEDPSEAPVTILQNSVVYRGPDAIIYANRSGIPRALVAHRVTLVGSERAAVAAVASSGFDPSTDVIVESNQPRVTHLPTTSTGGTVRVISEGDSHVSLAANLKQASVIMLDDAMATGWAVTVDGRTAYPLRVDDVLRGVSVPAGAHVIMWRYRVPGLRLGAILSGVAALVLLICCGLVLRGGYRRRRTSGDRLAVS
jgi:Bacterial membrane protein YfhO